MKSLDRAHFLLLGMYNTDWNTFEIELTDKQYGFDNRQAFGAKNKRS